MAAGMSKAAGSGQAKRPYQKELEKLLEQIDRGTAESGQPPRLFLHSCCAPCSTYVLQYLSEHFEITDFFFNPNIEPEQEYRMRARELERLIDQMPMRYPVTYREGRYEPSEFHQAVKGLEQVPEGGERCAVCFELRLREAARLASEGGFDYFATTLSISPLKNAQKLNEIGERLAEEYGVKHLPNDFKKKGGYQASTELSKEYGLYRQDYCGCVYSKAERLRQKQELQKEIPQL